MSGLRAPGPQYGGTEGHAGSGPSRERAEREAKDGTATSRQEVVLAEVAYCGPIGVTWQEVATYLGLHHGQATSALSNLHKAGSIARLTQKRGRSSVYVLPEHVEGRETAAQGRSAKVQYPHGIGSAHVALGPEVVATVDGESIVWKGRRYHPVDSHDSRREREVAPTEPLFDM